MTFMPSAQARNADHLESAVPVPESLRPWLTELGRIPTVTDVSGVFVHIPQSTTTLVVRTDAERREAFVVGPQTRAFYTEAEKPAGCVRMRLAPGTTRQLLGVVAADLADRTFRLADMPGVLGELAEKLTSLSPEASVQLLEESLPQRISENATQRMHRDLLGDAVAAIVAGIPASVPHLAAELAVSERQLRNLFTTGIGLSPKYFERIVRLRRVLVHAGNTPWSRLAVTSGFYDQSHLAADFRALMGVPPATFFRGDLPAPTPCRAPVAPSGNRASDHIPH